MWSMLFWRSRHSKWGVVNSNPKQYMNEKQRTLRQNRALHKWMDLLSVALNDAGLSIMKTLRQDAEIPWSAVTVKELMFKEIMKAMYLKDSTTQLTTKELIDVCETLTRYLAEKHGLQVDFPSMESLAMKRRLD